MKREEMEREAMWYYDTFNGHSQFQFVRMLIENVPTEVLSLIVRKAQEEKESKVAKCT